MSLDANAMVKMVKRAAVDAVNAGNPFALRFGEVTAAEPLEIRISQKITLTAAQLILTDAVRDFSTAITADFETEETGGGSGYAMFEEHSHEIKGVKTVTVHRALAVGERVILLQCDGGQKFIVLSRLEAG